MIKLGPQLELPLSVFTSGLHPLGLYLVRISSIRMASAGADDDEEEEEERLLGI